jgi:hypothetical protein
VTNKGQDFKEEKRTSREKEQRRKRKEKHVEGKADK